MLVANACLLVLSRAGDLGIRHLVPLRLRFKKRGSRQRLDTLLAPLAAERGLSLEDLTDATLPDFGLVGGQKRVEIGEVTVEIAATGRTVETAWVRADSKWLKSAPAAVRREHPEAVQAVRGEVKLIRTALTEQRTRIESFYDKRRRLLAPAWRQSTLDHGLASVVARGLVWQVEEGGETRAVLWDDGRFIDAFGNEAPAPPDDAHVTLWHPVHAGDDELAAWRERLAERRLVQPFRQVYRSRYVPIDAERAPDQTQCRRFDGHVIRQSPFGQLASSRGWAVEWAGYGGDGTPPSRKPLPAWALTPEVDTEPIDNPSVGRWEYVTLWPVCFRTESGDVVPLGEVPPVVFSETLRDVELFVAKASVGAEAQPPVPGDPFFDYWQRYHFGELEERAQARRDVLSALLPHLPDADRLRLNGRFLHVEGALGRYRIHLGSGSAQTEGSLHLALSPAPVPMDDRLFLPFDDDPILTLVLSKAALLAADDQIEDPAVRTLLR